MAVGVHFENKIRTLKIIIFCVLEPQEHILHVRSFLMNFVSQGNIVALLNWEIRASCLYVNNSVLLHWKVQM